MNKIKISIWISFSPIFFLASLGQAAPEFLSPQALISTDSFKQTYQQITELQSVIPAEVSPELSAIIEKLSQGSVSEKRQAMRDLFNYSKRFIEESIFTVSRIDTDQIGILYDIEDIAVIARSERIILITPLKDKSGNTLLPGNTRLRDALVQEGVITADAAAINGLILSPMRDASPFKQALETLQNRSFAEQNPRNQINEGYLTWKGIGSASINNDVGVPFDIDRRAPDNWIYGGTTKEETDNASKKAWRLISALEEIIPSHPEFPQDLFFKPGFSVQPIYLPVKADNDFSHNREFLKQMGAEIRPGVFLVPAKNLADLFKRYENISEEKEKDLRTAADEMRFFAYISPLPWRIRELWRFMPVVEEKLGTPDRADIYQEFIRRYALIAAIIHGYLDSTGASRAVLSGSNLSSMFSLNNIGYNIFDYHLLKTRSEYAAEYAQAMIEKEKARGILTRAWILNETVLSLISDNLIFLGEAEFKRNYLELAEKLGVPREDISLQKAEVFYRILRDAQLEFENVRALELDFLKSSAADVAEDIFGFSLDPIKEREIIIQGKSQFEQIYREYLNLFRRPRQREPEDVSLRRDVPRANDNSFLEQAI